jgi:two-component system LytT family sensor kinase
MYKTKYKQVLHALVPMLIWLVVLSLPFFSRVVNLPPEMRNGLLKSQVLTNVLLIVIFYVHTYLIYPLKDRKHGVVIYITLLLVCFFVFIAANRFLMPEMPRFPRHDFQTGRTEPFGKGRHGFMPGPPMAFLPFAFVIMVSYCYKLYLDKQQQERLIAERERIHLKTELEFLSSQISPHFMFNLLNTLVGMARKKSELMEPSLIRLSQLMRYMLYDNDGKQINLGSEVDYLKNYINLQLLRFADDVRIELQCSGPFERYTIAPMLLIPFVENAFKHGIGMLEDPIIIIKLAVDEKEGKLRLQVMNEVVAAQVGSPERSSGIGLANVRRRLELLYPGKFVFEIKRADHIFLIELEITL